MSAEDLDGNVQLDADFQIEDDGAGGALAVSDEDNGGGSGEDDFATFDNMGGGEFQNDEAKKAGGKGVKKKKKKSKGKRKAARENDDNEDGDVEKTKAQVKVVGPRKRRRLQELSNRRREFRKSTGERERHPLGAHIRDVEAIGQCERFHNFYVDGMKANGMPFTQLELEKTAEVLLPSRFVTCVNKNNDGGEEKGMQDRKSNPSPHSGTEFGVRSLASTVKYFFGPSWSKILTGNQKNAKQPGGPHVVVLTQSANRATEIIRGLKAKLRPNNSSKRKAKGNKGFHRMRGQSWGSAKDTCNLRIAKLFARHMKPKQQEEFLKAGCAMAVGTPFRVQKLCDVNALDFRKCRLICFDTKKDVKGLNLFTLKDTAQAILKLFHEHIYPVMEAGLAQGGDTEKQTPLKLCFF